MLGRMPTAEESKAFLGSKEPTRRQKLIEQLTGQRETQQANALKGRLPAQLILTGVVSEMNWGDEKTEDPISIRFIPSHTLGEDVNSDEIDVLPRTPIRRER